MLEINKICINITESRIFSKLFAGNVYFRKLCFIVFYSYLYNKRFVAKAKISGARKKMKQYTPSIAVENEILYVWFYTRGSLCNLLSYFLLINLSYFKIMIKTIYQGNRIVSHKSNTANLLKVFAIIFIFGLGMLSPNKAFALPFLGDLVASAVRE